jgi:hypothetical protein
MVASVSAHTPSLNNVRPTFVPRPLMKGKSLPVTHQEPNLSYNPARTIEKNPSPLSDSLSGATGDLGGADTLRAATALQEPPSIPKVPDRLTREEKSFPGNRNSNTFIPADLRNTSAGELKSNLSCNIPRTIEKNPSPLPDSLPGAVGDLAADTLRAATADTSHILNKPSVEESEPTSKAAKTSQNFIPGLNIGLEHDDPVLREIYSQGSPQEGTRPTQTTKPNFLQQISTSIVNLFSRQPLSSPTATTEISRDNHSKTSPPQELSIQQQQALRKFQEARSNLGMNNNGVFEFV